MKEVYILLRLGNKAQKCKVKSHIEYDPNMYSEYGKMIFHLVHVKKQWYIIEEKTGSMASNYYSTKKACLDDIPEIFSHMHQRLKEDQYGIFAKNYKHFVEMLENAEEVAYDTLW